MRRSLEGKVAIVTGSTAGIGRGIAEVMAQRGAAVVVSGRNEAMGRETVELIESQGGTAHFVRTDLTNPVDIKRLVESAVERFGGLDCLVNNAGIFPRARLEETDEELWDRVMAVNLRGPFLCAKHAVPHLRRRGGGSIINIGSCHGFIGSADLFAYAVSKGGLLTMTRNLARALARDRIRVNWITVGWVASHGEIALHEAQGRSREWLEEQGKKLPLGRLQTAQEIGYAAAYLASDEAAMVTGCVLDVSGGLRLVF